MTIKDLKTGMACTLLTMRKKGNYEHETCIRKIEGGYAYIDAAIRDGKVINFGSAGNYLVVKINGENPQIFQYIVPEVCRENGKACYKIDLKHKVSIKYNRRHNIRLKVGKTTNARPDGRQKTYACTIKDISAVGFALVFDRMVLPKDYKTFKKLQFVLSDTDPRYGLHISLELTGDVKRMVNTENDRVLYGCQIPYSSKIEKYIAEKEKIQKIDGKSGLGRVVANVRS